MVMSGVMLQCIYPTFLVPFSRVSWDRSISIYICESCCILRWYAISERKHGTKPRDLNDGSAAKSAVGRATQGIRLSVFHIPLGGFFLYSFCELYVTGGKKCFGKFLFGYYVRGCSWSVSTDKRMQVQIVLEMVTSMTYCSGRCQST